MLHVVIAKHHFTIYSVILLSDVMPSVIMPIVIMMSVVNADSS